METFQYAFYKHETTFRRLPYHAESGIASWHVQVKLM
jgi:hypothetical protein